MLTQMLCYILHVRPERGFKAACIPAELDLTGFLEEVNNLNFANLWYTDVHFILYYRLYLQ